MIQIDLKKTTPTLMAREVLTSGMVKAATVKFTFSQDWDELTRVAVFSAGETIVNCVLDAQDCCYVPWECLANAGERLLVGVYGTLDGEVVLPSEQCDLGLILAGSTLGEDASAEGSPSLAEQLIIKANEAISIAQSVRDDADAGEFNGVNGVDGVNGADGTGATITIGTVTTAAGSVPSVTNSGTVTAAVLDFALPAGPQGTVGPKGDPGVQGPQGVTGPKGDTGDSDLRIFSLSLPLSGWSGASSPYTQIVNVAGGTACTKVDLLPDAVQLAALIEAGVSALFVQNNTGVFTTYAIGSKPAQDLTLQACLAEVSPPVEG